MDALSVIERVKQTISLGESHFREFKSAVDGRPDNKQPRPENHVRKDIAEALVAFANADGGELLIGVEDDGTISGIPHSAEQIEKILEFSDLIHGTLPLQAAQRLAIDNKTVLFFSVVKSTTNIFQLSDGRCVRRKDRATLPARFDDIVFERQETFSREFDRRFVDGANVSDLDIDLLRPLAKEMSPERYLQLTGLAEYATGGLRLRMAALLLFARDMQKWHPRMQVRILPVNGLEFRTGEHYNIVGEQTVSGNIFGLLRDFWDVLRSHLTLRTRLDADAKFEPDYLYPELAAKEALTNAITHRDYSIQNAIEVWIFQDRMEIKSPGALLSTLTVAALERLEGQHDSRNVLVARVLRESNYVRELGEGVRRIFRVIADSDLVKPKLYSNTTSFSVTLYRETIYSSKENAWLSLFRGFQPSRLQKRVLAAGIDGAALSKRRIEQALNSSDPDVYAQEVTELRNAGILVEILANAAAGAVAKKRGVAKHDVERYRVRTPEPFHVGAAKPRRGGSVVSFSVSSSIARPRIDSGIAIFGANDALDEAIIREWLEPIDAGAIVLTYDRVHATRKMAFVEINDAEARKMALEKVRALMMSDPLLKGAKVRAIAQEKSLISLRRPLKSTSDDEQ